MARFQAVQQLFCFMSRILTFFLAGFLAGWPFKDLVGRRSWLLNFCCAGVILYSAMDCGVFLTVLEEKYRIVKREKAVQPY